MCYRLPAPRSGRRVGNPAGGPVGSRHRQQLNGEFIAALLRDFRQGGPKAIERVRRTQPASYLKILALLVPREHKIEHGNVDPRAERLSVPLLCSQMSSGWPW